MRGLPFGQCRWPHVGAGLLFCLLAVQPAEAAKNRNAAILARVLSFELSLDERVGPSVGVAVVYKSGDRLSEANADEWMQGLRELSSVRIKDRPFFALKIAYAADALLAAIDQQGIDVLLVADGLTAESDAIVKLARSKHTLTAGNAPSYVEKDMTLCVTEQGDNIKIIVNLNAAHLEGIRFSSSLLKLATIIR
jgi:YfiR/HmsC-like